MKYIFLEKTDNKEDPFYTEYLYFITDNKDFDYSKLSDSEKSLIHFKDDSNATEISVAHNSPENFNHIFGNIYIYILHNNLSEQKFLKFTIDEENNIEKAE